MAGGDGAIPVLSVAGQNVPEAWERAVLAVWDNGVAVRTEYDKPGDPPSLDATVTVVVRDPLGEPRIHKNFPGGPAELEVYRQEVVEGIHDHWIAPREGKWTYTYHQRLFAYRPLADLMNPDEGPQFPPVNQIEYIIEKLAAVPYSRRAQAVTWIPHCDPETDDPPCLQRLWARLLRGEEGFRLNVNTHWRSRDLYKAWFMNVYALTDLQRLIAERLADLLGEPVGCGRYVDVSDSLHIYGSYRDEELEREIEKMKSLPYTDRAWDSSTLEPMFEEAREKLAEDVDFYARGQG
ncbi:MAG: thymidylate synthase [Candidatus Brocadiaceae bacterium]|jgi:thymidylate synthase